MIPSRHHSEDDGSVGSAGSQQVLGGISLVVTSDESLSGAPPRQESAETVSGDEWESCRVELRRVNANPVKTYGATTDTTMVGSRLQVVNHLSVESILDTRGPPLNRQGATTSIGGLVRTRRVTVHTFNDTPELKMLRQSLSSSSGLHSGYHSCSLVDGESKAFSSNKLFAGDNLQKCNWHSCEDLRKHSTGSMFSDITRVELTSKPVRIASVSSCCSLGHVVSSESGEWRRRHQNFDARSTQSDPATLGKEDSFFLNTHPEPRQVHSDFPTFIFDPEETAAPVRWEDLSFLQRLRPKGTYGSSYRGLVSGEQSAQDGDKDSLETGSISTMQTVQYDLMDETPAWRILAELILPFFMAGLGMIGAGLMLDSVQHWDVFTEISEVFILVPALLGLKGNLEMTLASRLSTQANLGNMDSTAEQWKMIIGNLALTQAQAIVVGFLAAVAAMVLGWIPEGKFDMNHAFLLCCSSVLTAAFASFVLGTIMILVVLLSRKCHVNPDNVATPIAASLGDLTTLALLSGISSLMYKAIHSNQLWLSPTLLFVFLGLTPIWCVVSHRNKYTHEILYSGWTPVIGAMVISSMGGLILDFAVGNYHGIAVFQPVINGVGGNLVAVQASRLSTALHRVSTPGNLPEGSVTGCPNFFATFFGSGVNSRTARVLMLLVVPGHLIFMYTIHYMQAGHTSITITFASVYLSAASIQVFILLYIANWLVHWLWRRGNDPDNFSIPYLTALGDLLGTGLLAAAFHFLYVIGDRDADVGD